MNKTILIVDDEPKIVQICRDYLTAAGFDVISAETGPIGLAAARRDRPDLIVLDLMLPGIHNVRAKGTMTIHGESQEIFINCQMNAGDKSIQVKGVFNISLSDYNISIPKVVSRKIAEEIRITVNV